MTEELLIAGYGGQGVLSMGKILAYSGIMQDKEVSWLPSYGPEMRGGTANVTVILSDEKISSPILQTFDSVVVLNQQSMEKFEEYVKPGGMLLYDEGNIRTKPTRTDIQVHKIDAIALTKEVGNFKTFNMVVLGAYLKIKPIVKYENVIEGLKKSLPVRHHGLIPINEKAIQKGMEAIS